MPRMHSAPGSKPISPVIAASRDVVGQAAKNLETSAPRGLRRRTAHPRPPERPADHARRGENGPSGLMAAAEGFHQDSQQDRLEDAISEMLHALRDEFHRSASLSTRHEV